VPALYLLHGVGGNYTNWMTASHISELAKKYDMAIVLPDGGPYGWYIDSPMDSSSCYESYLVQELIPYVQDHYPVRNSPSARAISGLSMGGHGAVSLALKHPHMFGAVSSMSGILDLTIHPTMWSGWQLDKVLGAIDLYPQHWHANNCYDLVLQHSAALPVLYFDCGLEDHIALQDNQKFVRRLDSLHIAYSYRENPGGHRWDYWDQQLDSHLQFFDSFFNTNVHVLKIDQAAASFRLAGSPNPFNDRVVLVFTLPSATNMELNIYNAVGQKVQQLASGYFSAGEHRLPWHNDRAGSGQYLVVLTGGQQRSMIKLVQVR
jgi:S-formylglutathione hydrolase FrmB